jgi:predicted hydrocarbon binding protein
MKKWGQKMFDIRKVQEQVIYEAVKNISDDETAKEIVYGKDESAITEGNPAWVKSTMKRLENHFDNQTVKQIRMNCQCGYGMDEKLELIKELLEASSSIDEFGNLDKAKAAGLYSENGELYLQFPFCPCPMVAEVDRLETNTWCQCTTGYSKVLFEKAFECKVDVELLKSIKMGDEKCLMKIIPQGTIWK